MEENETSGEKAPLLIVTEDIRSYIYDTARWAKFLSIIGFVLTALMVFLAFSMGAVISSGQLPKEIAGSFKGISGSTFTIVMLFYAMLFFYPSLMLYKFSAAAIQGILYGDQDAFTNATARLKGYFRFWGLLVIIVIALNLLALLNIGI